MLGFGVPQEDAHGRALTLRTPDGREKVSRRKATPVVMTGAPGELALFMSGRKEAAA